MAVWPAFTVAEVEPPGAVPTEKSSGAFMDSVSAADVLPAKFVSPKYVAVIEWGPTASNKVLNIACPFAPRVTVASGTVLSKNCTMPVGVPAAELKTVAVNVTGCAKVAGF